MTQTAGTLFDKTIERSRLGELSEEIGSPGQCLAVRPLKQHPDLLFKEYRPNQLTAADHSRLAALVQLPARMSAEDRRLLLASTAWPRTRVVEDERTVGVLVPRAPERFYANLRDPYGDVETIAMCVDHLANPDDRFPQIGLAVPGLKRRLEVCRGLAAVAAMFERHGIVYGDWSYQNAFWSPTDGSIFVIDADGCSFGPQPWVESIGFEDALTPAGKQVDAFSDRFRCAIMISACLVGARQQQQAVSGLAAVRAADAGLDAVSGVLRQIVTARPRESRPALSVVHAALTATTPGPASTRAKRSASHSPVVGWDPVVRPADPPVPAAKVSAPKASAPKQGPTPKRATVPNREPTRPAPKSPPAPAWQAGLEIGGSLLILLVMVAAVSLVLYLLFEYLAH